MPDRTKYQGKSLADALDAFAEHHYEERTRHISADEYELLKQAVAALRTHAGHRMATY